MCVLGYERGKKPLDIVWWSGQVNWLDIAEEGATRRVNDRSSNKPNQNHDGAAMHTVAAVEESIAINWNQ